MSRCCTSCVQSPACMNAWLYILWVPASLEHLYHPGCSTLITGTNWILIKVSQRKAKAPCWATGQGLGSMEISPCKSLCHILLLSIIYTSHLNDRGHKGGKESLSQIPWQSVIKQIKWSGSYSVVPSAFSCRRCGSANVHEDVPPQTCLHVLFRLKNKTTSTLTSHHSQQISFCTFSRPWTEKRKKNPSPVLGFPDFWWRPGADSPPSPVPVWWR